MHLLKFRQDKRFSTSENKLQVRKKSLSILFILKKIQVDKSFVSETSSNFVTQMWYNSKILRQRDALNRSQLNFPLFGIV